MASSHSLTEDDRTRFINRKLADEMASFLVTVMVWGSNKAPNQTFKDYLTNKRNISLRVFKKYFSLSDDMTKINQTSFDGLDVTFLSKLLPLMCNGIAELLDWKNINDSTSLEFHLNQIRTIRNSVMHEAYGAALNKNLIHEVETTASELFNIAGAKYGKRTNEINAAKDGVRKLISTIKNTLMTEEETVDFYRQRIVSEGLPELQKNVIALQESISPYFKHVNAFCCLQLTYKENILEKTISCEKIFTHDKAKGVKILIIEGQRGAGKSHLMKELQADVLREKGKIFKGSDEFDTPLLFECRKRTCETIAMFASEELPCLGATLTEKGLTEKVLNRMKCILLIDGIDEVNEISKIMIDNITAYLKNNREMFFIFTSRPCSAENFRERLKREGISDFQTLALKELASENEQMEFLKISCKEGKLISSAYEGTNLNLQSPVLLAIYSYLWLKNSESLKSCKSKEQIIRTWMDCGLEAAKQQLEGMNVMDCEDVAKNILESISFTSFYCLIKNQFEIKTNEIEWLKGQIKKKFSGISVNMAPHEILSCFSVGSSDSKDVDIQFYAHKSHKEVLSSLYVAKQIHERGKFFRQILIEALEYDRPSGSSLISGTNYDFQNLLKKWVKLLL